MTDLQNDYRAKCAQCQFKTIAGYIKTYLENKDVDGIKNKVNELV